MYDSHVNGLRECYLTFAPLCVWLTTGNMWTSQNIALLSRYFYLVQVYDTHVNELRGCHLSVFLLNNFVWLT